MQLHNRYHLYLKNFKYFPKLFRMDQYFQIFLNNISQYFSTFAGGLEGSLHSDPGLRKASFSFGKPHK